ncbi:hypothetical protein D3C78_1071780 [compost metagenome]
MGRMSRRMTCISVLRRRTRFRFRCLILRQSTQLTVAGQRRWQGVLAVQEAAMYRRLLLIASMSLSLTACVPYYDGGSSYYSSEVYSSPMPAYYAGGPNYAYPRSYYTYPRSYYSPSTRYYPSVRYYQAAPRYYQAAPRYYQSSPRYYQAPRAVYRSYPNRGWDDHHQQGWSNQYGSPRHRQWDNDGGHGGREHGRHGDHDGRSDRGGRNR